MSNKDIVLPTKIKSNDLIFSPISMRDLDAIAQVMSKGVATVPKHLQGKPADCLAIVMQSAAWNMSPYQVAQKTHLINGTLGYEAQLLNAVISSSTAIEGRFHYRYSETFKSDKDPEAWVQVGAVIKGESDIQWGERLYPATVATKNSPLWKSNPKQQCCYLALKYWARIYTPAVIMGVYTQDEIVEFEQEKDITPVDNVASIKKAALEKHKEVALDAFDPMPAIEDTAEIMREIAQAETVEELDLTAAKAGNVCSDDLDSVRKAYKDKKKVLTSAPLEVVIETETQDKKPEEMTTDEWQQEYSQQ